MTCNIEEAEQEQASGSGGGHHRCRCNSKISRLVGGRSQRVGKPLEGVEMMVGEAPCEGKRQNHMQDKQCPMLSGGGGVNVCKWEWERGRGHKSDKRGRNRIVAGAPGLLSR